MCVYMRNVYLVHLCLLEEVPKHNLMMLRIKLGLSLNLGSPIQKWTKVNIRSYMPQSHRGNHHVGPIGGHMTGAIPIFRHTHHQGCSRNSVYSVDSKELLMRAVPFGNFTYPLKIWP